MAPPWSDIQTVLCDLDGVVWLAHDPIPGSVEAVERLRATGRRVLFVTNNSSPTLADHEAALAAIGIDATGDVVSSAMAAARLVRPGERVLAAAGPGVVEALERCGAVVTVNDGRVSPAGFDAVVVGMHRSFDFDRVATAASAVRSGARLIGTNTDATYPTPSGLLPGSGALLAAIATAAAADPEIAGKPHAPMVETITAIDPGDHGRLMVGDRLETDGLVARRLGCPYALVRSGVTGPDVEISSPTPSGVVVDLDVDDLAEVASVLTRATPTGG